MSNEGRSLAHPPAGLEKPLSRRRLCVTAVAVAAASLSAGIGWLAATWRSGETATRRPARRAIGSGGSQAVQSPALRVAGASMAPTLLGLHGRLRCEGCGIQWAAHWQQALRPSGPVICWNCGADVATGAVTAEPGSLVRVSPLVAKQSLSVGDLVAIDLASHRAAGLAANSEATDDAAADDEHEEQSLSIKRIAALPGQSVTYDRTRLLVDGAPVLPQATWIPVHDDAHRRDGHSWWEATNASAPIRPTAAGFRFDFAGDSPDHAAASRSTAWLVYRHRDVHNRLRPDAIRDDVPENVSEVRALQPAGPLRLSLQIDCESDVVVEVAFWRSGESELRRQYTAAAGGTVLQVAGPEEAPWPEAAESGADAGAAAEHLPPLSATEPIAIGIHPVAASTAVHLSQIRIDRALQYTIDPRIAVAWTWPLVLGENEYYLLGDNVPLSIDSRHFGPVDASRIVGLVQPVSYDDRPR